MGWTSCRTATKQSVIADEVLPNYTSRETGKTYKTRKWTLRGSQCWSIRDIYNTAGELEGSIICLILFESHGGSLAWKNMDETAGPFYYDIPLGYLDESTLPPDVSEYAAQSVAEWRAQVRQQADAKNARAMAAKTYRPGDIITLREGFTPNRFELVQKIGASWQGIADGRVYKLGPKALAAVVSQ